jgi:hypothetical protein
LGFVVRTGFEPVQSQELTLLGAPRRLPAFHSSSVCHSATWLCEELYNSVGTLRDRGAIFALNHHSWGLCPPIILISSLHSNRWEAVVRTGFEPVWTHFSIDLCSTQIGIGCVLLIASAVSWVRANWIFATWLYGWGLVGRLNNVTISCTTSYTWLTGAPLS